MASVTVRNQRCSIARSLEILGEKWSLLIVRDSFLGSTRFSEFQQSLGVAKDVLSNRLATLVEAGILERRTYREPGSRERAEYVLTEPGRDLYPVMAALSQWGDRHRPTEFGPSRLYVEAANGEPVRVGFINGSGSEVPVSKVAVSLGPGAD